MCTQRVHTVRWMCTCKGRGCTVGMCVCVCVLSYEGWRREQTGGLHSSASPSSCTPGTRAATCLRGFQYPPQVCVCVCVCVPVPAAVFTQGMQFIIFVCVSGYYIHSLHTCARRQTEPEKAGAGASSSTVTKKKKKATKKKKTKKTPQ